MRAFNSNVLTCSRNYSIDSSFLSVAQTNAHKQTNIQTKRLGLEKKSREAWEIGKRSTFTFKLRWMLSKRQLHTDVGYSWDCVESSFELSVMTLCRWQVRVMTADVWYCCCCCCCMCTLTDSTAGNVYMCQQRNLPNDAISTCRRVPCLHASLVNNTGTTGSFREPVYSAVYRRKLEEINQ